MPKCRNNIFWFLVTILFSCVLCAEGYAEDWVFYDRCGDSFFYDRKGINNPYEDVNYVLGVWQKVVYNGESVDRIAAYLGTKYSDLAESISMIEIDCSRRCAQTKALTYYDSKGMIIESKPVTKDDWKKIPPKSHLSKLYRAVCPMIQNNGAKSVQQGARRQKAS